MKQPDIENVPGWDEIMQRYLSKLSVEERLAGIAPEERLAGIAPEERLAGLAPEQAILALPVELLRMLREDDVRSLPADVQEKIRKRLH
jgi:hypothetical protein